MTGSQWIGRSSRVRHRSTTPEFTWPVGTRPRCVEGTSEPGLSATNRGAHCRLVAFLSLGNALSPPFPAPSCPAQAAAGPPDLSLLSPLIWLNWGEESRAGGGRELRVACCRPEPLLCVSRCPIFSTCSEFPEAERSPHIPPFCMFFLLPLSVRRTGVAKWRQPRAASA